MSSKYEVVFIVRPDAGEDIIKGIVQKAKEIVESLHGEVVKIEEWGKRRMAYHIKKYSEGYYVFMNISANPEISKEMDRILSLHEDVIRHQIIKEIKKTIRQKIKKKKVVKEINQ